MRFPLTFMMITPCAYGLVVRKNHHLGHFALFPSAFGMHYPGVGLWVFMPHPTLPIPLPTHSSPDPHLPAPFWEPWFGS